MSFVKPTRANTDTAQQALSALTQYYAGSNHNTTLYGSSYNGAW